MRAITVSDTTLATAVAEAASEPVIVRDGEADVAVVLSFEEYQRMAAELREAEIDRLHGEIIEERRAVFEALAK